MPYLHEYTSKSRKKHILAGLTLLEMYFSNITTANYLSHSLGFQFEPALASPWQVTGFLPFCNRDGDNLIVTKHVHISQLGSSPWTQDGLANELCQTRTGIQLCLHVCYTSNMCINGH